MRIAPQARAIAAREQVAHPPELRTGLGKKERERLESGFLSDIFNQPVENGPLKIGYGLVWQDFRHPDKKGYGRSARRASTGEECYAKAVAQPSECMLNLLDVQRMNEVRSPREHERQPRDDRSREPGRSPDHAR